MRTKRILIVLLALVMLLLAAACGSSNNNAPANNGNHNNSDAPKAPIADGVYTADKGKGVLTVKDGQMVIHVTLVSKSILNLFPGTADDAKKDGAKLLEPSVDKVKYSDGIEEEAYGFDIPVPYLDKEFDCAIIGEKGKWYDHKVSVSNPELQK